MKKLISMFLAVFLMLFGNSNIFLAGGEDKEVILSDGTKLIYVSTEKIPEVLEHYRKKTVELLDKRPTFFKSVLTKGIALGLGGAGWYLSEKLENTFPNVAFYGKAISVIFGLTLGLYTNVVDYVLGREYCDFDDRNGHLRHWGPREGYGVATIYSGLNGWYHNHVLKDTMFSEYETDEEKNNSGIVIVLRPRSKWNLPINTITVYSGIYPQCEMEYWKNSNEGGYLYALKKSIEDGV